MDWKAWCLIISLNLGVVSTLKNETRHKPENLLEKIMTCERGWYSFENKCYKVGANKKILNLHYLQGLKYCNDLGGTLAAITSKEISDFVNVFLILQAGKGVWIGLADIRSEGKFYWEDGTPMNYTNWAPHEPSHNKHGDEDCVEMRWYATPQIGEWNDNNCGVEIPFICQKEKIETPESKAPLDPRFCSEENNSGWKFRNSCFNLVREKKSWEDAEMFCKDQYSGHLVTLRDVTYDMFLDYMLRSINEHIWLGIKIKESYTQKWSSGWFVGYSGWKREKKDFVEGTCATRTDLGKWGYESCTKKFAFVCESSTDIPPVLAPSSVKGSVCPEEPYDWRDLGGDKCYFFETELGVTWYRASFNCMQRGGNLVSIHSKEELDVLRQFVKYIKFESVMIGLHLDAVDGNKFSWSDRTPFDFINWDVGEPNSDREHCSVAFTKHMKFHNHLCEVPRGYICAVKKVLPPANRKAVDKDDSPSKCTNCIPTSTFAGVLVCILFIEGLLGIIWLYYFKPRRKEERKRKSSAEVTRQRCSSERYRMRQTRDNAACRSPPASFDVSESEDYEAMS